MLYAPPLTAVCGRAFLLDFVGEPTRSYDAPGVSIMALLGPLTGVNVCALRPAGAADIGLAGFDVRIGL